MLKAVGGVIGMIKQVAKIATSCDIIYANTQKAAVVGAFAGKFARRPVVWYLHDIMTSEHFGKFQLLVIKYVSRHLLSGVVCNSVASRDALVKLTGLDPTHLPVVYNGIPAEPFDHAESEPVALLRERFRLPKDAFLVGCFSRLAPWKGQHVLLDAIARDADTHAVLVGAPFFGSEKYAEQLQQQVKRLGIEARVHFAGFQADVPRMMRAMDVVAHTSIAPEPFGRVIVEGMLAGKPVIGSKAGGVTEIIDDGRSGLLVNPDDAAALSNAITALRHDLAMAHRIAMAGQAKARASFTPAAHCRKMTEALMNHLNSPRRGASAVHMTQSGEPPEADGPER
ncbi:glycosyltransferase family 4 protein [Robbsia betulipollinis]|uniref:glycosyltransferase family 4 protein n=1 Tax=Robbsia betulipollinis TaxID=2981849 RepID=UPI00226D9E88